MKGTPWTVEEEIQLKKLLDAKTPIEVIASNLRRTSSAILLKCQRLGLAPSEATTHSAITLPAELPSIEETLKDLAAALQAAKASGLNKVEVQRLQAIATLARTYKEILADYLDYRGVEAKLIDMEAKYATLLASKNDASQPVPAQLPKNTAQ